MSDLGIGQSPGEGHAEEGHDVHDHKRRKRSLSDVISTNNDVIERVQRSADTQKSQVRFVLFCFVNHRENCFFLGIT